MKKLTLALVVLICACTQQGVSNETGENSSHLASNEKSAVEPADGPFGYFMGQSMQLQVLGYSFNYQEKKFQAS